MNNNTDFKISQAVAGLNTDNILAQFKEGQLTFAKNALVENFDGKKVTYQNEQSNSLCLDLYQIRPGYKIIGVRNIIEQGRTILFITNPVTGECEIGQRDNNTCIYTPMIWGNCLGFNIHYPIHKVIVKTTNCSTQIYWTDGLNNRRWMDFEDLPWREIPDPNNSSKNIKVVGDLDCNKILVQPNFNVPIIKPTLIDTGGKLIMGSYQFAIQYANSLGEGYTSMYGFTNTIGIYESKVTPNFNEPTTKSIVINVSNIDTTGLYDYFNIIVLSTINGITTPKLVQTIPIVESTYNYTYTGNNNNEITLSNDEIFQRFLYYDVAQDVTSTDNSILWADLSTQQKISWQKAVNNIVLRWVSYKIPENQFEGYTNGVNTSEYRGYLRDESYIFEFVPVYKDGRIGDAYPIPGREVRTSDQEIITNDDAKQVKSDPCEEVTPKPRWKVYNTATNLGFTDDYIAGGSDSCYKGTYQYGDFAYNESTLKYPNNVNIWGTLANTPIRLHKFPDCTVSPIHDEDSIYALGVMIDTQSVYSALSSLPQSELDNIAGFKITRANRAGNQSIIAKGLLYNVGKYIREAQTYFYPNYPFNDVNPDPLISSVPVLHHSGTNSNNWLRGFDDPQIRYTLHSPNLSFEQPRGIDTGYLNLETIEYGNSQGHFVEVRDNAKYKFLTNKAIYLAFAAAMSSMVSLDTGGGFLGVAPSVTLDLTNIPATFSAMLDVLRNIAQAINYGWQFNSVGTYTSSIPVATNGNKVRSIIDGAYLSSNYESIDGENINNYQRESSVYLKLGQDLPFTHEQGGPIDNSRFTIEDCNTPNNYVTRDISSYYGSIKRVFEDQYGPAGSYESIDTGYYQPIDINRPILLFAPVFGGDTFINRFGLKRKLPFFLDNTVSKDNQTDIALNLLGNVGYPIYFYGTNQIDADINLNNVDNYISILTDFDFGTIAANIVTGGTRPLIAGLGIMLRIFRGYLDVLGVNNINLDCYGTNNLNEIGKAYLFAYGIAYFYCESDINVEFRQATNEFAGNYYPNVGTSIPDDWLQENRVSIINDNSYTYNTSYSKQIKEIFFTHLRPDFDPNKTCLFEFPNRVIYSQKANLEETKNNWLVYRPVSYFDFPKNYGALTAIDGLEDRKILARFENKSLLYNVYQTTNTSTGTVYLGNPNFFSAPPLDFAETDIGYNGSQNKFIVRTEFGHITIDSERGQIFMYRGNQIEDISAHGMEKWFTENLSFRIKETFPLAKIDNHFNGVGITGVYDNKYNRLVITKIDYQPISNLVSYNSLTDEYEVDGIAVSLNNSTYFCNVSWTISYSFMTQSWISFHSYVPNGYIPASGYFDTIMNDKPLSLWRHNMGITFQNFYGQQEDYILEYPLHFSPTEEIISSFTDATVVLQYTNPDVSIEVEYGVWFNKAVVYNNSQCSGYLNLTPKPDKDMKSYFTFPKFNNDTKDILYTKRDSVFSFNTFWDIVQVPSQPFYSRPCSIPSLDKIFDRNLDYSPRSNKKARIRSRDCRIRLIYNDSNQYKFVSEFTVTEGQKSII